MHDHIIDAQAGNGFEMKKGSRITITDLEGRQVVDFFAVSMSHQDEFLSAGVTIDCNDSLKVRKGDALYTNLYNIMFRSLEDDVEEHDLLHPCCRKEMYDFFYRNGAGHSSCLDNLNRDMETHGLPPHHEIRPFNIFMHTKIHANGRISVEEPKSKAGDKITLLAEMDVVVFIAACSVSESKCNGGRCSPVKVRID